MLRKASFFSNRWDSTWLFKLLVSHWFASLRRFSRLARCADVTATNQLGNGEWSTFGQHTVWGFKDGCPCWKGLPVNSSHTRLVTKSTRHKQAHKKAIPVAIFLSARRSPSGSCSTHTVLNTEGVITASEYTQDIRNMLCSSICLFGFNVCSIEVTDDGEAMLVLVSLVKLLNATNARSTRRPASAARTARHQVQATGQPVSRTQASDAMTSRLPRYETNCVQRRCFQCGSVRLRSAIKGTELPPANVLIPLERQLIALQLCRWEFLYNETFQQTFRPLLSKLSKRRQI